MLQFTEMGILKEFKGIFLAFLKPLIQHANIIRVIFCGDPSVPDPPFQQSGAETPDVANPPGRTRRCLSWDVQPEEFSGSLLLVCFNFVIVDFVVRLGLDPLSRQTA